MIQGIMRDYSNQHNNLKNKITDTASEIETERQCLA